MSPRPLRHLSASLMLLSLCASTASAQLFNTEDTIRDDDLTITFSGEEEFFLNVDNCLSRINTSYIIQGNLGTGLSIGSGELNIFFTRGTSITCDTSVLDSCPDQNEEETCQCVENTENSNSLTTTLELVDLWPEACDEAGRTELRFTLNYFRDSGTDDSDTNSTSDPAKVIIDLDPPDAPEEAPTISPSDGALVVAFPELRGTEEIDYEVCYRALGDSAAVFDGLSGFDNGSNLPDAGGDRFPSTLDAAVETVQGGTGSGNLPTNDALRTGYSCDCDRKDEAEFRCGGLTNGETYEVVYAILDEAGNRSENSPVSYSAPGSVLDFAERYSGGETGGCEVASGASVLSILALAFGGLFLLTVIRPRRQ